MVVFTTASGSHLWAGRAREQVCAQIRCSSLRSSAPQHCSTANEKKLLVFHPPNLFDQPIEPSCKGDFSHGGRSIKTPSLDRRKRRNGRKRPGGGIIFTAVKEFPPKICVYAPHKRGSGPARRSGVGTRVKAVSAASGAARATSGLELPPAVPL